MPDPKTSPRKQVLAELNQLDNYVGWSAHFMKPEESEPAEIALAKVDAFVRFVTESETARVLCSEEYSKYVAASLGELQGIAPAPEDPQLRLVP